MNTSQPRLVVLSGAGMSAESGIATFRGAGGLWEGHRVEEVASPEGFAAQPETYGRMRADGYRFVRERYAVEEITARTFDPDFQRRTNLHHVFLLRHAPFADKGQGDD